MKAKKKRNLKEHVFYVNELLNTHDKIIIFDTETTGFERDAKIIQFSAILYNINDDSSLTEIEHLDLYINPQEKLDPVVSELTGITDEMLEYAATEDKVADKIMEFMNKANLWTAYNIPFDIAKLESMCARCHIPFIEKDYFDTLIMVKNLIPKDIETKDHKPEPGTLPNHKLGTVTEFLLPEYKAQFHNSLEDVRATGAVLEVVADKYKEKEQEFKALEEAPKEKLVVDWASFWQNPHSWQMRRISIFANRKNTGIFWDIGKVCWSHNANKEAAALFAKVDIADIEKQVMAKYARRFGAETMDDLAYKMAEADKIKKKAAKEAEKKQATTPPQNPTPTTSVAQPITDVEPLTDIDGEEIDLW